MAFGELGRQRILECKTIDHVLHVLWMSPEHAELVELSLNLFFDLSFSGGAKILTETPIPVQFFLKLLKVHEKHVLPVKEIVRTLGRIYACSDTSIQSMMVRQGVVPHLLPLFGIHESEPTIAHQLEMVCSRIARLPVPPYESVPQEAPSLVELTANVVLNRNLDVSLLPEDLRNLLQEKATICDNCNTKFVHPRTECILSSSCDAWCKSKLPYLWTFCSRPCMEHKKLEGARVKLIKDI